MSWILETAIGLALLAICGGLGVHAIDHGADTFRPFRKGRKDKGDAEIRRQLQAMDSRLTEIQDVMIALSEKIDRLEGEPKWATGGQANVG